MWIIHKHFFFITFRRRSLIINNSFYIRFRAIIDKYHRDQSPPIRIFFCLLLILLSLHLNLFCYIRTSRKVLINLFPSLLLFLDWIVQSVGYHTSQRIPIEKILFFFLFVSSNANICNARVRSLYTVFFISSCFSDFPLFYSKFFRNAVIERWTLITSEIILIYEILYSERV